MNYKNTLGSGLLLLLIIILVTSYYINEYKLAIWQQKKVLNLEKIKLQSIENEDILLKQALDKLLRYKILDNIPEYKSFLSSFGNLSFKLINKNDSFSNVTKNCTRYNIYRIDIDRRIDLNKLDKYHEKRNLYVMICEYIKDNNSSGQGVSMIQIFPITNVL